MSIENRTVQYVDMTQPMNTVRVMVKKKKLPTDIGPKEVEQFTSWSDAAGLKREGAAKAAFTLLSEAPPILRDHAMHQNKREIRKWFEEAEYLMAMEMVAAKTAEAERRRQRRRGAAKGSGAEVG